SVNIRFQHAFWFLWILRQRFQRFDDEKVAEIFREDFTLFVGCESQFAHPLGGSLLKSPIPGFVVTLPILEVGKRLSCKNSDFLPDFVGHVYPLHFVFLGCALERRGAGAPRRGFTADSLAGDQPSAGAYDGNIAIPVDKPGFVPLVAKPLCEVVAAICAIGFFEGALRNPQSMLSPVWPK